MKSTVAGASQAIVVFDSGLFDLHYIEVLLKILSLPPFFFVPDFRFYTASSSEVVGVLSFRTD